MNVSFVAQPFDDGRDLRDFLDAVAADPAIDELDVVVAWAKRSGLRRVRPQLEAVRDRPGTTRLIVGIDEGGATRQGLHLAREIFSTVHVFHDRSSRTFHPKVYLGVGSDRARLLVGSNNLTAGGVFYNYEAALECELQLPGDQDLVKAVREYIDRLLADGDICKELDDDLLAELIDNPRYRVRDEDKTKSSPESSDPGVPEDVDAAGEDSSATGESVFGTSSQAKRADPAPAGAGAQKAPAKKAPAKKAPAKKAPAKATTPTTGAAGRGAGPSVRKRWFKEKMSHSDAQQPKTPTSNIKGIVTLGSDRGRHPINPANYFRDVFFSNLNWTSTPVPKGTKESATFNAEIVVNGSVVGNYTLTVDHQTSRISDQNNVPTWLHWDAFGPYLQAHDHVGDSVSIERLSDGTFRVVIESNPTGPFLDM